LVEWTGVGLVGLELTGTLLRTARTQALQTAITATALLSDKLVADLMKPRYIIYHFFWGGGKLCVDDFSLFYINYYFSFLHTMNPYFVHKISRNYLFLSKLILF